MSKGTCVEHPSVARRAPIELQGHKYLKSEPTKKSLKSHCNAADIKW